MSDLTKGQVEDYKRYYIEKPSSNFSPKRNKEVIEATIKKAEALRKAKMLAYNEKLGERIDAASHFIMHLEKGGHGDESAEKYFGSKVLAELRGQQLVEELQERSGVKIIKPFIG